MFSDLECDFMNPIEMCSKLNALTLPEFFLQAFLSVMFLVTLNVVPFIFHAALTAFHYLKWKRKQHIYDATEIFRQIPKHKIESFAKLIFYLVSFFYFLYRFVVSLVDA